MRIFSKFGLAFAGVLAGVTIGTGAALANPVPWEMGLQPAETSMMEHITSFHNMLLWIITGIVTLVLLLLLTVMIRFNARSNPTPSKTTHNTLLEVVWTVIPIFILVVIASQSFPLLFFIENGPKDASGKPVDVDLTIKATGNQWNWSYAYPDIFGEDTEFVALMCSDTVTDGDCKENHPRLLGTTFDVVVPVHKNVRVLVTGSDVIHSWAMPSFGVKMDGVPGRINETWFRAEKEGMYYGQCSELCGTNHAFMPIAVKVVSQQEFDKWVASTKQEYGIADNSGAAPVTVAAASKRGK